MSGLEFAEAMEECEKGCDPVACERLIEMYDGPLIECDSVAALEEKIREIEAEIAEAAKRQPRVIYRTPEGVEAFAE